MKVETHNHPTAISPFPGAATGSGGEIRDEGATGRGAKPKAGLTGFSVSNLRIPGSQQPWESDRRASPGASPRRSTIMLDGPIGARRVQQRVRPAQPGRLFPHASSMEVGGERARLSQAHHDRGRRRQYRAREHVAKQPTARRRAADPARRAGHADRPGRRRRVVAWRRAPTPRTSTSIRCSAATPKSQRRAQEVIDRCWQLGDANPILSIHDVGAGGLSNALPELVHGGGRGARLDLRAVPSEEPGMSPLRDLVQRGAGALRARDRARRGSERFAAICARERCPFAVARRGDAGAAARASTIARFDNEPVDMDLGVLLGKPPRCCATSRIAHARAAAVRAVGHRSG